MATSPPKSLKPWNESGGNCNNPCMSSLVLQRFVRIVLLPSWQPGWVYIFRIMQRVLRLSWKPVSMNEMFKHQTTQLYSCELLSIQTCLIERLTPSIIVPRLKVQYCSVHIDEVCLKWPGPNPHELKPKVEAWPHSLLWLLGHFCWSPFDLGQVEMPWNARKCFHCWDLVERIQSWWCHLFADFLLGEQTWPFLMMCLVFSLGGAMVHEEMF